MGPVPHRDTDIHAKSSQVDEPPSNADVKLSPGQDDVFQKVKHRQNVFFTGSAGTGKSLLLRCIIDWCRERGLKDTELAITASTGMASMNIGGCTIHAWAGIGLGAESTDILLITILGKALYCDYGGIVPPAMENLNEDDLPMRRTTVDRWKSCKVLIIDEISMIDNVLFDKLEFMARFIRQNNKPFGGIQLVISGDFLQLPPVSKEATYAFRAQSWSRCIGTPILLRTVFRQKEQSFIEILNDMRLGRLSPEAVEVLKGLSRPVVYDDGIEPTDLFATRHEVDQKNMLKLAEIEAEEITFPAEDRPGWYPNKQPVPLSHLPRLLERVAAPDKVTVKEGAQVMLLRNLVQNMLVNGSVGKVIGYSTAADVVRERKSGNNKIYVAVPLHLAPLTGREFIRQKDRDAAQAQLNRWVYDKRSWPIVRFYRGRSRDRTVDILCVPQLFVVANPTGGIAAFREQVPLLLAYALTVHKAQGQTLERVRVDLSRVFEKGQAYVALSRVTSIDNLQLLNFDPSRVYVDQAVLEFQQSLTEPVDEEEEYWRHEL